MSPCGLRGGDPGAEPPKFDTGEACGNLGDNTMDISRFFRLFIPIRVLVGTDQHAGIDDVFQVAATVLHGGKSIGLFVRIVQEPFQRGAVRTAAGTRRAPPATAAGDTAWLRA